MTLKDSLEIIAVVKETSTLAQHHLDIKIKTSCTKKTLQSVTGVLYVLCLYQAQISGERLQDHRSFGLKISIIDI